jgi:hypothetical protein
MKDYETKTFQCEGICPKCGSSNLIWGDADNDGDGVGYEFECEDCGCTGTEWYNLVYAETIVDIYDDDDDN